MIRRGVPSATALDPELRSAIVGHVVAVLEQSAARFYRGDPTTYFAGVLELLAGLTLPFVPPTAVGAALTAKLTFCLWNVVVDDAIDREKTRQALDESALWQTCRRLGRPLARVATPAPLLLERFWAALPAAPTTAALDAIGLDIDEMLFGLSHAHTTDRHRRMATGEEQRKYGVATLGLKPLLDIDVAFAPIPPRSATYTVLRAAFDHLSVALKYASDIGSLERELSLEDTLNLPRILCAERSGAILEHRGTLAPSERAALSVVASGLQQEIDAALAAASASLARAPDLDSTRLMATADALVAHYRGGNDLA